MTSSKKSQFKNSLGSTFIKRKKSNIFLKQRKAPVHAALLGFLPYNHIYFIVTCAFTLYEFIETLEMHYYSFHVILDPIMVESIIMAMLCRQDHGRSRVAGSTHKIQDCDFYWLE
jgi:hypothetical protein